MGFPCPSPPQFQMLEGGQTGRGSFLQEGSSVVPLLPDPGSPALKGVILTLCLGTSCVLGAFCVRSHLPPSQDLMLETRIRTVPAWRVRKVRLRAVPRLACSTCGKPGIRREAFCSRDGAPTQLAGNPTLPHIKETPPQGERLRVSDPVTSDHILELHDSARHQLTLRRFLLRERSKRLFPSPQPSP